MRRQLEAASTSGDSVGGFRIRRDDPQLAEIAPHQFERAAFAGHSHGAAQLPGATELDACRHRSPLRVDFEADLAVGLDSAAGVVGVAHQPHGAGQDEQQLVDQMRSQIDEHAAAAALAREHRQRRELPRVLAALLDVHRQRPADEALLDHAAQKSRHGQQSPVEAHGKHDVRLARRPRPWPRHPRR